MSLQIVFNGQTIVKPGAASRVVSRLQNTTLRGSNVLAIIGTADAGEPNAIHEFSSAEALRAYYKSGDLADAAGICFNASNDVRVTGGPSKVLAVRVTGEWVDGLGDPINQHSSFTITNNGSATLATLTTQEFGLMSKRVSCKYDATTKKLSLVWNNGVDTYTETSPAFVNPKMKVASSSNTAYFWNDDTTFHFVNASVDTPFTYAQYPTLQDLAGGLSTVGCTVTITGQPYFPTANLDRYSSGNQIAIPNASQVSVYSITQDLVDWVNSNSTLCTAVRLFDSSATGAPAQYGATVNGRLVPTFPLADGSGVGGHEAADAPVADAAAWANAFTLLRGERVNACVPLISDYAGSPNFTDVAALAADYASAMSSSVGRNEVQVYMGYNAAYGVDHTDPKGDLITIANSTLNNAHVCLSFDKLTLPGSNGTLKVFPAWSSALTAAALRLSAPLGEPITYKYVRAYGLTWDSHINKTDAMNDLLLSGVMVFEQVPGKGTRIVKGNTTHTKTDDDAYTEESVVFAWKALCYDLRTFLEDTFTGTKGTPANVRAIADMAGAKLESYRTAEVIVDSTDANGKPVHAWRDLKVTVDRDIAWIDVTVTIVEGINFQLPTIYLAPVKLTA